MSPLAPPDFADDSRPLLPAPPFRRPVISLVLIFFSYFCGLSTTCLLEPLLPALAARKGMSSTLVGLLFGSALLITAIMASLAQPLLAQVGLKRCFLTGCLVSATCCTLTGLLDRCPPGSTFIGLLFAVQTLAALANAAIAVTANCAPPLLFPRQVGRVIGCLVLVMTAAYTFAPAVAGALNEAGGFGLPFFCFSGMLVGLAGLSWCLVDVELQHPEPAGRAVRAAGQVLSRKEVLVTAFNLFAANLPTGFLMPTLQPFLAKAFGLHADQVGLVFLASSAGGFFTPLAGLVFDRWPALIKLCQGPFIAINGLSILFWHPASFFRLGKPRLWLSCTALSINGLATSICVTAISSDMFAETWRTVGTREVFTMATGLLLSFTFPISLFAGSLIGGRTLETVGFESSTGVLGLVVVSVAALNFVYQLVRLAVIRRSDFVHVEN